MFAENTENAPCTDANNKELFEKELAGGILCTPQAIGSTMGAGALMGMNSLGVGFKAMLFSNHIDSISGCGPLTDAIWTEKEVITIDLLGDDFMNTVKMGDKIKISEDGTVEVG